jgi:hypothetical protein
MAHGPRLSLGCAQGLQELATLLRRLGSCRPSPGPHTGSAPHGRQVPDPGAAMTDHITKIAEHERSTRRWILPFAILVIAAIVAFLVLLTRPDL